MSSPLPLESILVTGPTGYVGGRLVPRLLQGGYRVRVMARDAGRLSGRSWVDQVEVVEGNVLRPTDLPEALRGVDAAYYLIHNMSERRGYREQELLSARYFGNAARAAGVKRIIYLGALGDPGSDLAPHLASRQRTGQALAESGVPVTEFRAAIIVGSGSISFEMIRYLTEKLPVMICPRWVYQQVQPIAIEDVLSYLTQALTTPESAGRVIEIGGADRLPYAEMMTTYAELRGLKRWLIPVPVLSPGLSSHWVHWITPVPASVTRPLIEGLRNEIILTDPIAQELFPSIQPVSYREAVGTALENLQAGRVETRWCDALYSSQGDRQPVRLISKEGLLREERQIRIKASLDDAFMVYSRLGGETGWLYMNWAWQIRGWIDRLLGGSGLRRGRRDPDHLRVGDAVDFWRVEEIHSPGFLRLRAEMLLPGEAWLQFQSGETPGGDTLLLQTAIFAPRGLAGFLYWYSLYPFHAFIFSGLIRHIKIRAEAVPPLQID
jgi:uncharacterized protein YbjT (DUF2867 family)